MKVLIVFISVFLICCSTQSFGAVWYVDKDATGANNGTSWADAWTGFGAIKWGGSGVQAGDTVFISGGASSKTYTEILRTGNSGTAAKRITIGVGQDANHNGRVVISNKSGTGIEIPNSYITIDGRFGGKANMAIEGCASHGIAVYGHHVDLKYLDVSANGESRGQHGIYLNTTSKIEKEPLLLEVSYCSIHDNYQDQIHLTGSRGPQRFGRIKIHNNEIYGLHDDGVECGTRGLDYYNNVMHTFAGAHSPQDHPDGVAMMAGNFRCYNNIFYNLAKAGDHFGTSIYPGLYSSDPVSETGIIVQNNIVYNDLPVSTGDFGNKAFEFTAKASNNITSITNMQVTRNTFVGTPSFAFSLNFGPLGSKNIKNVAITDNIIFNCYRLPGGASITMGGTAPYTTGSKGSGKNVIFDRNIISSGSQGKLTASHNNVFYRYDAWKTATGFQKNVVGNPDPRLDQNLNPQGLPANLKGIGITNLKNMGNTLKALSFTP